MSATAPPEPTFTAAWRACQEIEGWLSDGQAQALFTAATAVRPGEWIVEIGSHHGRSTVVLAVAKAPDARLLAIDPWEAPRWGGGAGAEEAFNANLEAAGVTDRVQVFKGTSAQAAQTWSDKPVGLLFVDGAHDYASVIADIDNWEPHVSAGGTVAIHDGFSSIGVTRAMLRKHLVNRRFRYLGRRRTLALYRREDLTAVGALASAAAQALQLTYFARNGLVKLAIKRGWPGVARLLRHRDGAVYPY